MKVAFDLKNLWLYGKGIGTFTINLLRDLSLESQTHEIQLYAPSFEIDGLQFIHEHSQFKKITTPAFNKKNKFTKVKYDQITLLRSLYRNKSDILFSPYFDIPIFWRKTAITTIHDLSIYEMRDVYSKAFYAYYELLLKKAIRHSSFIVTVSQFSRQKLIDTFNIPNQKIKIIYNKVPYPLLNYSQNLSEEKIIEVKSKYKLPNDFILYTGGIEIRKNICMLINGVNKARKHNKIIPKLVMTGVSDKPKLPGYSSLFKNENIIPLSFISYEEVACLYRLARLIVNTSNYEGFGIPVLEALTMQKPMLCSDIDVYKEIGKDCVYYFNNNDESSFSEQLIAFFNGKLPSIDRNDMLRQADFFNKRNYSRVFSQMINECK
jgi:glycosyltransferase involved in cell wall biosynthesis